MKMAREFTFEPREYEMRRAHVRRLMAQKDIDTLILHSPANIYYLSGHYTLNLWDYQCLILSMTGNPVVLIWHFEEGRFAATAVETDLDMFGGGADPIAETRMALERRGLLRGTIGIEKDSPPLTANQAGHLTHALSGTTVVDGSGIVDSARFVKSPAECDYIRRAGKATDVAMQAAFDTIDEGVSDHEVAAQITSSLVRSGSQNFAVYPMIAVGPRSGVPHHSHEGLTIERGQPVFLEFSPSIRWYQAPIMRAAIVGEASDLIRRVTDTGARALDAMCAAMRPGVAASQVAEAGRAIVDEMKGTIHFHYVFAYSVGIGFPPTWLERAGFGILLDNHAPLEAGMVFHFPMTLRVKGEFGVGQSQTVIVTETGAEVVSSLPLGLHQCGRG